MSLAASFCERCHNARKSSRLNGREIESAHVDFDVARFICSDYFGQCWLGAAEAVNQDFRREIPGRHIDESSLKGIESVGHAVQDYSRGPWVIVHESDAAAWRRSSVDRRKIGHARGRLIETRFQALELLLHL